MTTQHNQMSTENPLKIGDVVRLRSDRVLMTIVELNGSADVVAGWHDSSGDYLKDNFPVAALIQASQSDYDCVFRDLDAEAKSSQTAG